MFNDFGRVYHTTSGSQTVQGFGCDEGVIETQSLWINVDDKLGVSAVYGTDQLYIRRPGRRQIGLRSGARRAANHGGGMLYADELCGPYRVGLHGEDPGTVLVDTGFVLQAGVDHETTAQTTARCAAVDIGGSESLRALTAEGVDGSVYLLIANAGNESEKAALPLAHAGGAVDLVSRESLAVKNDKLRVEVQAGSARLLRVLS
jgi:hypothetical protein